MLPRSTTQGLVQVMTREERYRACAAEADSLAADTRGPDIERQLNDLAERWRGLVRQAAENDAARAIGSGRTGR